LAIYGADKTSELLAWKLGVVKHFEFYQGFKNNQQSLKVDEVDFDGLRAIFTIYGDKSNNFVRIFPPSAKEAKRIEFARQIATLEQSIEQAGGVASKEQETNCRPET
jgi:hypothetical protein